MSSCALHSCGCRCCLLFEEEVQQNQFAVMDNGQWCVGVLTGIRGSQTILKQIRKKVSQPGAGGDWITSSTTASQSANVVVCNWLWTGTVWAHMNIKIPLCCLKRPHRCGNWNSFEGSHFIATSTSRLLLQHDMEESLTRAAYIFKALIGIASKVAPPAALPYSCCTATSVSGRVSLEGRCRGGPGCISGA